MLIYLQGYAFESLMIVSCCSLTNRPISISYEYVRITFCLFPLLMRLKAPECCLGLDASLIYLGVDSGSSYEQDHSSNGNMEVPGAIGSSIQRFSLALLSNIHSIIPLLSFLRETMPKLTRNNSETIIRIAALISLISRFPSDSVSSNRKFIQLFRFFLLSALGLELIAFSHLGKSDHQRAATSAS